MAVEVTVHHKNFHAFCSEFGLSPPQTPAYCGKITFTTHADPGAVQNYNAWLASKGYAGLAAPVYAGEHAVLLQRPRAAPGQPPAQRPRVHPSWAAAIYPHIRGFIQGARMELLEADGHAVALAPRNPHAHAQILAVAEAFGLQVRRGAKVPGGHVRGILTAAGGGIGGFEAARSALAAAATSLVGEDVLVAQVPGRGTCTMHLALEALHARRVDPARLPNRIGDYALRWSTAGGEALGTAGAPGGDTWAELAQGVRRSAIARRLADVRAAAAAAPAAPASAAAAPAASASAAVHTEAPGQSQGQAQSAGH